MTGNSLGSLTRNSVKVGVLSAGILLMGTSAAHAADNWNSSFNSGIGSGNQIKLPIQAPINICGIAIGILGDATASCTGGAEAQYPADALATNWNSQGNSGILSGNQVFVPVQAPINACGVGVGVLGDASAFCQGGSSAVFGDGDGQAGGQQQGHDPYDNNHGTYGNHKWKHKWNAKTESSPLDKVTDLLSLGGLFGGGAQATPAGTDAGFDLDAKSALRKRYQHQQQGSCELNWNTSFNSGILSGNQVYAPIQLPIDVSGVAVGVLGDASASSVGGASAVYC
ncbi:chaplin [Catellatospora tritici]|uniref:chaplin n=1 Tax=Catellatospora tritici TaxID=2851566 RepID=UPI001C2D3953|nr:chaplin [Catellatospora tritici]MBV1853260.1 chaplin [Catellatospora tritici]